MNGGERKIEILKPFGEAFELTQKILFQPFNFEKWLVIGFAAFLAGHLTGAGFNLPLGNFPPRHADQTLPSPDFEQWKPMLPILIAVFAVVMVIFIVVFSWLRARGNFIFTDCVARNRAAIVEPWREYRKEGNSYFLFLIILTFGSILIFGLICLTGLAIFGFFGQGSDHVGMTPLFILFLGLFLVVWLGYAFFFGITAYFMVPLMYVRRYRAGEAFRHVAGLVLENAGSFILFCLFGICLLLGVGMISGIATCLTCCLALLPYVGTVILLPVFVFLRAYGLRFIRQFGPDYDVWPANVEAAAVPPPTPPPLQTGS
jgi:hypothetical protein